MRTLMQRLFGKKKPVRRTGRRTQRGRGSRRFSPVVRRRLIFSGIAGLSGIALAITGIWFWQNGVAAQVSAAYHQTLDRTIAFAGLSVDEVFVTGREQTAKKDILGALSIVSGQDILSFDPAAARLRLERLGWVKRAQVVRRLPNTIEVFVEERQPMALWQHKGRLAAIDRDGVVITRQQLDRFHDLPVVVGRDAPKHASALIDILTLQPTLYSTVEAAVRVGGRRWNLKMQQGVEVNLPAGDPAAAWARLAALALESNIFGRDIAVIDMRQPGGLVVRMTKEGAARRREPGEST